MLYIYILLFCSFIVRNTLLLFYFVFISCIHIWFGLYCTFLCMYVQHISKPDIKRRKRIKCTRIQWRRRKNTMTKHLMNTKRWARKKTKNATQRTEKITSTITRTIVFVFRSIHAPAKISFFCTLMFWFFFFGVLFPPFVRSFFYCAIFNTHSRANVPDILCLLTIIAAVVAFLVEICNRSCAPLNVLQLAYLLVEDSARWLKTCWSSKVEREKMEEEQNETN